MKAPLRRGLTLLELLLAGGLLSVMMTATYQLLSQSRRVAQVAAAGFDQDRAHIIVLRRLEKFLEGAVPYRHQDEDIDFRGDSEDLRLTTFDFRAPQQPSGPASIHLGQDGDGVFFEVMPMGFLQTESQRQNATFIERVPLLKDLELAYSDGEKWKDDWDFRKLLRLPAAIRVRVKIARDIPDDRRVFAPTEMIVPLEHIRDVGIR